MGKETLADLFAGEHHGDTGRRLAHLGKVRIQRVRINAGAPRLCFVPIANERFDVVQNGNVTHNGHGLTCGNVRILFLHPDIAAGCIVQQVIILDHRRHNSTLIIGKIGVIVRLANERRFVDLHLAHKINERLAEKFPRLAHDFEFHKRVVCRFLIFENAQIAPTGKHVPVFGYSVPVIINVEIEVIGPDPAHGRVRLIGVQRPFFLRFQSADLLR